MYATDNNSNDEYYLIAAYSVLDCRKGGNARRDHPIRIISTAALLCTDFDINVSKSNCKTLNTDEIFEGQGT